MERSSQNIWVHTECNHKCDKKGEDKERFDYRRDVTMEERGWSNVRKQLPAKGCSHLEARKGLETECPLEPPEGTSPADTSIQLSETDFRHLMSKL